MQCNICGTEKVIRPAGVSKATGKLYDSFMACPNYKNHPQNGAQRVAQQGIAQEQTKAVDTKWKEIRDEKRDDIKWMNALNNACLLMAHGKNFNKSIEELAFEIYEMEYTGKPKPSLPTNRFEFKKEDPKVPGLHYPEQQPEDLEEYGEEIDVNEIPF